MSLLFFALQNPALMSSVLSISHFLCVPRHPVCPSAALRSVLPGSRRTSTLARRWASAVLAHVCTYLCLGLRTSARDVCSRVPF